jgi:hypothetical protein
MSPICPLESFLSLSVAETPTYAFENRTPEHTCTQEPLVSFAAEYVKKRVLILVTQGISGIMTALTGARASKGNVLER